MFTLNSLTGEYWQGPPPMDAGYLLDQNARNLAYEAKGFYRGAITRQLNNAVTDVNTAVSAGDQIMDNAPAVSSQAQDRSLLPWLVAGAILFLILK